MQFIDSARFMASSLSTLVDKKFIKLNAKMKIIINNVKRVELNTNIVITFLNTYYTNVKNELILYKYLYCNKNYQKRFNEVLRKN